MTMRLISRWSCVCGLVAVCLSISKPARALDLTMSPFDHSAVQVRYGLVTASEGSLARLAEDEQMTTDTDARSEPRLKSPAKAFFMSLVVPGAGQWYYGSRIKPFVFLGVEAASWGLYLKYHGDGNDLTDEYEAFNRTHWLEGRYTDLLEWTYGIPDDDSANALDYPELTHHLPDTRTQQYYEMTGKYDQFSWGWDDAVLDGQTWENFSDSNPPPRVNEGVPGGGVPTSTNRERYETMRNDANNAFDKATRMVAVAIANHVVSALEAYFVTQHKNKEAGSGGEEWGSKDRSFWANVKVKPSLKSLHNKHDTPYVRVTYSF